MELITKSKFIVLITLICCTPFVVQAQTPPAAEKSPIDIGEIQIEQAKLPGSQLAWTKIKVNFTAIPRWSDGIVFNVKALLNEKSEYRVISGMVRYGNVPAGPQAAVFYISPRATQRFGTPVAVQVAAFHSDKEAGTKNWTSSGAGSVPLDWNALNVYPGILLNVMQTPWLMIDYEKSPDVIVVQ
jgi:hypothetical protein